VKTVGECRYSLTHSLTSVLHGGEWSASRSGRFTRREEPPYPLVRKLGGPQSRSGHGVEEKNSQPFAENRTLIIRTSSPLSATIKKCYIGPRNWTDCLERHWQYVTQCRDYWPALVNTGMNSFSITGEEFLVQLSDYWLLKIANRLWAGQSGFDSRQRLGILVCRCVRTSSGAHPASYPMGIGCSFSGVKRPGRESDHSPPSST